MGKRIFRKAITVTWVENRKDYWITDIQFLRPLRMLRVVSKPALPYLLTHKRKQRRKLMGVAWWLGLRDPKAGCLGSILVQRTRYHMLQLKDLHCNKDLEQPNKYNKIIVSKGKLT